MTLKNEITSFEMEELRKDLILYVIRKFPNIKGINDTAEDIVNGAFLKLRQSSTYSPDKENFAYLSKICFNSALKKHKKKKWEKRNLLNFEDISAYLEDHSSEIVSIDKQKEQKFVKKTLKDLKEAEQNIITLRYYENLDFHQISEKLDMNFETVRTIHKRTLKKLRPKLASFFGYSEISDFNLLKQDKEIPEADIRIELEKASILILLGKWKEASEIYSECIKSSRKSEHPKLTADSIRSLGSLMIYKNSMNEALFFIEYAYQVYQKLNEKKEIGKIFSNLGTIFYNLSSFDKAHEYYFKSLKILRETKDIYGEFHVLGNLGAVLNMKSEYKMALTYYNEQIEIAEKLEDSQLIGTVNGSIGLTYDFLGQHNKALAYYTKFLDYWENAEYPPESSIFLGNIGTIYYLKGEYEKAMDFFQKQLNADTENNNRTGIANAYINMGIIFSERGENEKSIEYLEKVIPIAKRLNDKTIYASALCNMCDVYKKMKKYNCALENCSKAIKIFKELQIPFNLCYLFLVKADICYEIGKYEEADENNEKAALLAELIKFNDIKFESEILEKKIEFKIGSRGNAADELREMLHQWIEPEEQAGIYFELYSMTSLIEYGKKSFELYKEISDTTPKSEYLDRISILKKALM